MNLLAKFLGLFRRQPKPRWHGIEFRCCMGNNLGNLNYCACGAGEWALRRYSAGHDIRPMCKDEREWCVEEANRAGEGYYSREELLALNDQELASSVLHAWNMYVQSNC